MKDAVANPTGLKVPHDAAWIRGTRPPAAAVARIAMPISGRAPAGASSGWCSRPVSTSHDVTVWPDTEARARPSVEPSPPEPRPAFLLRTPGSPPAAGEVPELDHLIQARRRERPPTLQERDFEHHVRVPLQRRPGLSGLDLP